MEHIWTITDLERKLDTGLVTTASYVCTSVHEGNASRDTGEVCLPYSDPADPEYILFSNLVEEKVVGWVTGSIDWEGIQGHNSASIAQRIAEENNKVYESGLPWE